MFCLKDGVMHSLCCVWVEGVVYMVGKRDSGTNEVAFPEFSKANIGMLLRKEEKSVQRPFHPS